MSLSDGRTLPWTAFRRPVKPYSFGVSIYTAVLAFALLTRKAFGDLLDGRIGTMIAVALVAATVLLWWGWWSRTVAAMTHGLLLSAAAVAAVAGTLFAEFGVSSISAWLAVPVVIASAGAWLLEVSDHRNGR